MLSQGGAEVAEHDFDLRAKGSIALEEVDVVTEEGSASNRLTALAADPRSLRAAGAGLADNERVARGDDHDVLEAAESFLSQVDE